MEAVMHGLYSLWWVEERHVSPALVAAIRGKAISPSRFSKRQPAGSPIGVAIVSA